MNYKNYALLLLFLNIFPLSIHAQRFTKNVQPFDKVIVSPHISVVFEKGDREEVIIEDMDVPKEKLKFEQKGNTLHIYLEGAKTTTKNETKKGNGYKVKKPIYTGTVVHAKVVYKKLNELSLRGEERFVIKKPLEALKFKLKVYGEANVQFEEIRLQQLNLTLYGESIVRIKSGKTDKLKITAYGESEVRAFDAEANEAKITAYGEAEVRVKVSTLLKVTAYGEADVLYKGNPRIEKGIVIGDAKIEQY